MNSYQKLGILLIVAGLLGECYHVLSLPLTFNLRLTIGPKDATTPTASVPAPMVSEPAPTRSIPTLTAIPRLATPTANADIFYLQCGPTRYYGDLAWSPDGQYILYDVHTANDTGNDFEVIWWDGARQMESNIAQPDPYVLRGWSPDGQKIAYQKNASEVGDLFVVDEGGENLTRIANDVSPATTSAWSPDGKNIAYVAWVHGNGVIALAAVDGSGQRWVTDGTMSALNPSWSPDGQRLAFQSNGIYVINIDGTGQTRLTDGSDMGVQPLWSPSPLGYPIIYTTRNGSGQRGISMVDPNVGGPTQLVGDNSYAPSWSLDGKYIAYITTINGSPHLYIMNSNGTGNRPLTDTPPDGAAAWSPDGLSIAFVGLTGSVPEIYRIDSDGQHQTRLTHNPGATDCTP